MQVDFGEGKLEATAKPIEDRTRIAEVMARVGKKYWTYRPWCVCLAAVLEMRWPPRSRFADHDANRRGSRRFRCSNPVRGLWVEGALGV